MNQSLEIPKSALEAEVLKAMMWRYATKAFDKNKKIPKHTFDTLLEVLRLTPSSLGLQPWKFIVVNNPNIRRELCDHSWDQPQVTEASHYIVLCSNRTLENTHIDRYLRQVMREWQLNEDDRQTMINLYHSFLPGKTPVQLREWMGQQVYIALGNLIASAAICGVDACPIEAFDKREYDRILGTGQLGVEARVAMALGYRLESDVYAAHKKVRFTQDEVAYVLS